MPPPSAAQATVDLNPSMYQSSLNFFRSLLETAHPSTKFLRIAVKTPAGDLVDLQVRTQNAYIVAFHGADDWYYFDGEKDAWGQPAGISSNYSHLGSVGNITYDDLKNLGELGRWSKGSAINKRLVAITIAITAEASRFATVATYFTGLTNSVGTGYSGSLMGMVVNFEHLKSTYFNSWQNPPVDPTTPGVVYTSVRRDIIMPHR
jgi:hypothetical protein